MHMKENGIIIENSEDARETDKISKPVSIMEHYLTFIRRGYN